LIIDTSALLAFFNAREPMHKATRDCVLASNEALVVSPFVMAELDYLVASRLGVHAELLVLGELSGGAWELPEFTLGDLARAASVVERYRDQRIGLADASNVVLADRYRTRTIATLDHRHFDLVRPLRGGRFRIVP
jgi:predicted nucleic acid-binding protein